MGEEKTRQEDLVTTETSDGQTDEEKPKDGEKALIESSVWKAVSKIKAPATYDPTEEALLKYGLSQKAELRLIDGQPAAYEMETGKRIRYLSELPMKMLIDGPKFLRNFQSEIRLFNGRPVVVSSYDISDRYSITVGIKEASDEQGRSIDTGLTKTESFNSGEIVTYFLVDKTNGKVIDIKDKSIIPEGYMVLVGVDDFDLKGESPKRINGATDLKQVASRLITSMRSLGTYFHEAGHAQHLTAIQEVDDKAAVQAIMDSYENVKGSIGSADQDIDDLKTQDALEKSASTIGRALAGVVIEDADSRKQVDDRLDEISNHYSEKIAAFLK